MSCEDDYLDVLQNIEAAIVEEYHQNPAIKDNNVICVLEIIMDLYSAEKVGRDPRSFNVLEQEEPLLWAIHSACEWRLGRKKLEFANQEEAIFPPETLSVDEILSCLKKIYKSVQKWHKHGGQRGYLDFVEQFIR